MIIHPPITLTAEQTRELRGRITTLDGVDYFVINVAEILNKVPDGRGRWTRTTNIELREMLT